MSPSEHFASPLDEIILGYVESRQNAEGVEHQTPSSFTCHALRHFGASVMHVAGQLADGSRRELFEQQAQGGATSHVS